MYSASAATVAAVGGCLSRATGDDASVTGGAAETGGDGNRSEADLPGADDEVVVHVGGGEDWPFEPRYLHVRPGATVRFVWQTGGYELEVTAQPEGADWRGVPEPAEEGSVHERAFDVPGVYRATTTGPHDTAALFGLAVSENGLAFEGEHPETGAGNGDGPGLPVPVDLTGHESATVAAGPAGRLRFHPAAVEVSPGTTVRWEWESDSHNVVPQRQPDGAGWEGLPEREVHDEGFVYEHAFEVPGTYEYYCAPHRAAGMRGAVTVVEE